MLFKAKNETDNDDEEGVCRYYHPSYNNFNYFDTPSMIKNHADLDKFLSELDNIDLLSFCRNARQSTVWRLLFCTQIRFRVTKIRPHTIGVN